MERRDREDIARAAVLTARAMTLVADEILREAEKETTEKRIDLERVQELTRQVNYIATALTKI